MVEVGGGWWRLRFPPPTFTNLDQPPPSFCSFPAPETPYEIVEHQKLLVDAHALPLAAELAEELAQAPAGEVAGVELDHLGRARRHSRNAGRRGDAVVPVADARDDEQAPRTPQSPGDEVASGGVLAAPRAGRHPVVHAAVTMRAGILEVIVAPRLRPAAPGAEAHRVHHAAAAAPIAAGVELQSLRRLQRLVAPVLLLH